MIFLKNTTQLAKRNIFMKNGNEARVVAGDSNKRCRDARQRQDFRISGKSEKNVI